MFQSAKVNPTLHNEHKTYLGEDEFIFNGRRLTYFLVSLLDNSTGSQRGSYYITGDEWGMKKRPKYEWSAGKQI